MGGVKQDNYWLKFHHSVLLFVLTLVLFICYLVSTNFAAPPPAYLFWAILIPLFFLVVWQTGKVKDSPAREHIMLAEIFFLAFALHLIFVLTVPYGLFGRDAHFDYYAAKTIAEYGWPVPQGVNIHPTTRIVSHWPANQLLGGMFSSITGLPLFLVENMWAITKWLPSVIGTIPTLLIFIIAKRMYHNNQAALLAAFAFSTLSHHVMMHSSFIRGTLAFSILFLVVYFCVLRLTHETECTSVLLLSMVALLFAHHLTFVILLIFLILLLLSSFLVNRMDKSRSRWSEHASRSPSLLLTVLIIAIVVFLSYLMYIGEPIFETLIRVIKELYSPVHEFIGAALASERTVREQATFYTRLCFYGVFGMLLLNHLFKNRAKNSIWDFLGLGSFIMLAAFIVVDTIPKEGMLGMSRIESLLWPFILVAVVNAICHLQHKHLAAYLLTLFALFQMFLLPSYIYDRSAEPSYQRGGTSLLCAISDYAAVDWFGGSGTIAVGDVNSLVLLEGLKQAVVVIDLDLFTGDLNRLGRYDWLVIRTENFKGLSTMQPWLFKRGMRLSESTFDELESYKGIAKIYANNNVYLYVARSRQ